MQPYNEVIKGAHYSDILNLIGKDSLDGKLCGNNRSVELKLCDPKQPHAKDI